jgi:hypothetical protein
MGGVSQYCLAVPDTPLIQETQDMNVPVNFFAVKLISKATIVENENEVQD